NRNLNNWLGSAEQLKFDDPDLLNKLNNVEIDRIDKCTINSVLEILFPKGTEQLYGIKKINQRRYLPLYLNNDLFQTSFRYTELVNALQDLSMIDLIENKIQNRDDKAYLLHEIKGFLLEK